MEGRGFACSKITLPDIIVQNQPLEKPLIYFFNFHFSPHRFNYFNPGT